MIRFDAARRGPLEGVRVLDLSRLVAGNMVSLQLADLGADVVKVEPPRGDPLRDWLDAAPKLGEHTDAVLAEAGYDRDAIAALRREGAAA